MIAQLCVELYGIQKKRLRLRDSLTSSATVTATEPTALTDEQ